MQLFLLPIIALLFALSTPKMRGANFHASPDSICRSILRREMGKSVFQTTDAAPPTPQLPTLDSPFVTLPSNGREVRAVWLCTLGGMDWPGRQYAQTPFKAERQRQLLRQQFDRLKAAGINTILFQTRLRSTVAYASTFEPWDGAFSGTPGVAPPYDVLQFAIDEAHARGMELHAYLVVFPICSVEQERQLGKQALPRRRPDLCQRCGDRWMMDPGIPATADYIAALVREIVDGYDIDGIHLDYIRYPEREIPFDDSRTYQRYGAGQDKAQWRRDNVSRCVEAVSKTVREAKPWIKISCSPIGKYADLPRQSARGWNARDIVFQDAQRWLREGTIDMLFPMMYFDREHFYPFLFDWQQSTSRGIVVPGLAAYFLSPREGKWQLDVLLRQLNVSRSIGLGHALFRSQFLLDNHRGIYDHLRQFDSRPALSPALTWRDSIAPAAPTDLKRQPLQTTHELTWSSVNDTTPITYNLYRLSPIGWQLIEARIPHCHFAYKAVAAAQLSAPLALTAMDAYGNESAMVRF